IYARFNRKVQWSGSAVTYDEVLNPPGGTLPGQGDAGVWFLQGALTDPGAGTRRFGFRATLTGGATRPAAPALTCALGGGTGSCVCNPQCRDGGSCGPDGCGGSCGSCSGGLTCTGGTCVCTPQCSGKACGPDGCGGTCGTCASGTCNTGTGACEGCTPV